MALDTQYVSRHNIQIFDRGGKHRQYDVENVDLVKWGRVRDEISEARFVVSGEAMFRQADALNAIEGGRAEIVVWRGDERMWEGPVTRTAFSATSFECAARDIGHYLQRTVMHGAYSNAYPKTVTNVQRLRTIFLKELIRKEQLGYNLLDHIVYHDLAGDAKTTRVTKRYQKNVWQEMDDIASKSGMDYTVIGRALHLWDTHRAPFGRTPTITENDFLGEMKATSYGLDLATAYFTTNGDGTYGRAGGNDPYYGEVEMLATAYDEEVDEGPAPTQAELNAQAQRNLSNRNPTPMELRIPDNSQVNPKGVMEMKHLVPGIMLPALMRVGIREVSQAQKLNHVDVEETATGETIKVSMSPFPNGGVVEEEA